MSIVRTVALLLCGALAGCLLLVVLWTYFQDDACPFCGASEVGLASFDRTPATSYRCGTFYTPMFHAWFRSVGCVKRAGYDGKAPDGAEVNYMTGAEKPKPPRAIDELRRLEKKYGEANPKK